MRDGGSDPVTVRVRQGPVEPHTRSAKLLGLRSVNPLPTTLTPGCAATLTGFVWQIVCSSLAVIGIVLPVEVVCAPRDGVTREVQVDVLHRGDGIPDGVRDLRGAGDRLGLDLLVLHPFQPGATVVPVDVTDVSLALVCLLKAETSSVTDTMSGTPTLIFSDTFSDRLHDVVCVVAVTGVRLSLCGRAAVVQDVPDDGGRPPTVGDRVVGLIVLGRYAGRRLHRRRRTPAVRPGSRRARCRSAS